MAHIDDIRNYWEEVYAEKSNGDPGRYSYIRVFRPPGGRYEVRDIPQEPDRLSRFRADMRSAANAKDTLPRLRGAPGKPKTRRTDSSADKLIADFLAVGQDENAANMASLRGRPLFFGVTANNDALPFVECKYGNIDGSRIITGMCHVSYTAPKVKDTNGIPFNPMRHQFGKDGRPLRTIKGVFCKQSTGALAMRYAVLDVSTGVAICTNMPSRLCAEKQLKHMRSSIPDFAKECKKAVSRIEHVSQEVSSQKWFTSNGVPHFDYMSWRCMWDADYAKEVKELIR